jgi:hypothetical protein
MEDRIVKIQPDTEGDSDFLAHIRFPIENYYKSAVEEVSVEGEDKKNRAIAHVKVVIWGSLYIEATINRKYKKTLKRVVGFYPRPDNPADVMWGATRRKHIRDKLEVIQNFLGFDNEEYDERRAEMDRLYQLRNRLVHYKESPTKVTLEGPSDFSEVIEKVSMKSENYKANIVEDLTSIDLETRQDNILDLGEWLESSIDNSLSDYTP